MDKKITIQIIDVLKSSVYKDRSINEYLISIVIDNGNTKIEAYTELGDEAKRIRVNELLLSHYPTLNLTNNDLNYIIQEIH